MNKSEDWLSTESILARHKKWHKETFGQILKKRIGRPEVEQNEAVYKEYLFNKMKAKQ